MLKLNVNNDFKKAVQNVYVAILKAKGKTILKNQKFYITIIIYYIF